MRSTEKFSSFICLSFIGLIIERQSTRSRTKSSDFELIGMLKFMC